MFEKVSFKHPDKVADRIAGAIVDLAYTKQDNPKVAVEVLIGHGECHIINETSCPLSKEEIASIVYRIAGPDIWVDYREGPQDEHLADNQKNEIRCGDNGIFKGVPITKEQRELLKITKELDNTINSDGKYIINTKKPKTIIVCQSNATDFELVKLLAKYSKPKVTIKVNPLGEWTGGTDVDCGATNRKLGSDMGDSVTGGGLHGKDLSKADVSVSIYCWIKAQKTKKPVNAFCAIGDTDVIINGKPVAFKDIVEVARTFIRSVGGFESFAKYGLLDPYTIKWL